MLTLPSSWSATRVGQTIERLRAAGAAVWSEHGDRRFGAWASDGIPSGEVRVALSNPGGDSDVDRLVAETLASITSSLGGERPLVARQWNPTWSMLPDVGWRDGETSDSSLAVRAFTSAPVPSPEGNLLIADAELHVGGTEVVHVREYADTATLLAQAEQHGAPGDYSYLRPRAEVEPPGMVGAFIGWERLTGVLLGAAGADRMLPFPRRGDGNLAEPSLRLLD